MLRAVGVGIACLWVVGCVTSTVTVCSDGRVCPAATLCDDAHHGCMVQAQADACAAVSDGSDCKYGSVDGTCDRGVCLVDRCGDGYVLGSESCDSNVIDRPMCSQHGYYEEGVVACNADCTYDTSACRRRCGDDVVDPEEQCEDGQLGGVTNCLDLGFQQSGPVGCGVTCHYDTSQCTGYCGDGLRGGPEQCEGTDLGAVVDCRDLGFYAPNPVTCGLDCRYDASLCNRKCGDGAVDPEEQCEPTAPGLLTDCTQLGFYNSGALGCNASCRYDVSACTGFCGDGVRNGPEECDGQQLGVSTCKALGYYEDGALSCAPGCTYDTSQCGAICGDGVRDPSESCDGTQLGTVDDCRDLGFYDPGAPTCNAACGFDTSMCTGFCGDGMVNGLETCERRPPPEDTCVSIGFDLGLLGCSASCTVGADSCLRANWNAIANYPSFFYFNDVWASARNNAYVASEEGVFHWTGAALERVALIASGVYWGVWGSGPDDVWAGGDDHLYHYNGVTWTEVVLPGTVSGDVRADSIWGSGPQDVYVLTGWGTYHLDTSGWTKIDSISGRDVHGSGPNDVWIVGSGGMIRHYDGTGWSTVSSPLTGNLWAVWVPAPGEVLVGNNSVLSRYDGSTWTTEINDYVAAIWGSGPQDIYAGGTSLFHYDGLGWSARPSPNILDFAGIWGVDGVAFEVGGENFLDFYEGATASVMPSGTTANLEDVWGTSMNAFAVGAGGTIVHWDGLTWTTMTSGTAANLYAVWGSAPDNVYAVGVGVVLRYNGVTWSSALTSGSTYYGVWGSGPSDVYVTTSTDTVQHYNGSGWSSIATGNGANTRAIWGSGPNDVYVAKYNFGSPYPVSHWNGATWTAVPLTGGKLHGSGPTAVASAWGDPQDAFYNPSRASLFNGTSATDIDPKNRVGPGSPGFRPFRDIFVSGPGDIFGIADGGLIFHFDGVTWWPIDSGTTANLNGLDGARGTWWAVGDNGTIVLITRDPWRTCTAAGAERNCTNQIDDDCDFLTDGEDPDCHAPGVCWGATDVGCNASVQGYTGAGAKTIGNYGCSKQRLSGLDDSYRVVPIANGTLTATLSGLTQNIDLFALGSTPVGACDPSGACLASSETTSPVETVTIPITAGQPVFLVVDDLFGEFSPYTLTVTCN